jgi:hypothetical protein
MICYLSYTVSQEVVYRTLDHIHSVLPGQTYFEQIISAKHADTELHVVAYCNS